MASASAYIPASTRPLHGPHAPALQVADDATARSARLTRLHGMLDEQTIDAFRDSWQRLAELAVDDADRDVAVRMRARWLGVVPRQRQAAVPLMRANPTDLADLLRPPVVRVAAPAAAPQPMPVAPEMAAAAPLAAPITQISPTIDAPQLAETPDAGTFRLEAMNPGNEPWPFDVVAFTFEQVERSFAELEAA